MGSALIEVHGLTTKQAALVRALALGRDERDAYFAAGYAGSADQAVSFVRNTLRLPHVAAALHAEVAALLVTDGVRARRVALDILNDTTVGAKIRADLAIKLLRLGGHVEPRAPVAESEKERGLAEMGTGELQSLVGRLEAELADRARPVSDSSATVAPEDLDLVG